MARHASLLALTLLAAACGGADEQPAPVDAPALDAAAADAPVPVDAPVDAPPDSRIAGVPDPSGPALVGLDLVFTDADVSPIQFLVTWTLHPAGTLDARYQPLCVNQAGCPDGRIPVGDAIVVTGAEVSAQGTFRQRVAGTLPGQANPISGTNQPFDASFAGTIRSTDLVCGAVTGTVAGIDLAGTTFAAIRITDESPAAFPAPVVACPP